LARYSAWSAASSKVAPLCGASAGSAAATPRLMVTMPSDADFKSDVKAPTESQLSIGEWCNKFFKGVASVPTENRQRLMRFIENLCLGSSAVGYRTESLHGAGSPQAQRIMIARQGNIEGKKALAKKLTGIKD
jgi:4-hydroxybutyryl-CoA dehydratase/vinylacetyl-CoA-Delta-isomerase